MPYKHYTRCFNFPPGRPPYNEKDRPKFLVFDLLLPLLATGAVGAGFGLLGGPIGAAIGAFVGLSAGFTLFLQKAADEWLTHRLVCLSDGDPKCAIGVVSYDPTRSDLGAFDNDQFFNVVLMPHPTVAIVEDGAPAIVAASRYDVNGAVKDPAWATHVTAHPANDILGDQFQAETLLKPHQALADTVGYATPDDADRWSLHCEAEGDFWVRMKRLAPALGPLLTVVTVTVLATAGAGAAAGAAAGCAIGGFFGPIGCAIGAIIGALLGGAAAGAAAAAIAYFAVIKPILQSIFDHGQGDVQDANVGDSTLGPIKMGDRVAVLGLHVYDGYHDGWHELHPLMAVIKIETADQAGATRYLEWSPQFGDGDPLPQKVADTDPDLTPDDMRAGLNSDAFRARCEDLLKAWCGLLHEAFDPQTRTRQQGQGLRWAVHPLVDGCDAAPPDPPIVIH